MKYLVMTTALVISACTVPLNICDREAQKWNKFDTVEDQCQQIKTTTPDRDRDDEWEPKPEPEPESELEHDDEWHDDNVGGPGVDDCDGHLGEC